MNFALGRCREVNVRMSKSMMDGEIAAATIKSLLLKARNIGA
jgi:hypothetical protein